MRFDYTVENSSASNRRVKRNAIKYRLKQKKKYGFTKGDAVYDHQIGINPLKETLNDNN